MPWGRVDDKLHSHPKADKAGVHAMGLWALAMSYCCDALTDGFVSAERVKKIAGGAGPKLAASLVKAGLWHASGAPCADPDCDALRVSEDGYRFHGWAERQPTRAAVDSERARKIEAGRKGGNAKAANLAGTLAQTVAAPLAPASPVPLVAALLPIPIPIPIPIPDRDQNRDVGASASDPHGSGPSFSASPTESPAAPLVVATSPRRRKGKGASSQAALAIVGAEPHEPVADPAREVFDVYLAGWKDHHPKATNAPDFSPERRTLIVNLLKGKPIDRVKAAARGAWLDTWHRENDQNKPQQVFRNTSTFEKFEGFATKHDAHADAAPASHPPTTLDDLEKPVGALPAQLAALCE